MKKFLIVCLVILGIYAIGEYMYYNTPLYTPFDENEITTNITNKDKVIYLKQGETYKPFEIKGVNMGAAIPGYFATEYAISKKDYLRWFEQIKEMGANTIRVYTILSDDFYEAVYEYNKDNPDPLYIIHGLWVDDYVQNSHMDAYADDFLNTFLEDSKTLVDIIHGKKKVYLEKGIGSGIYKRDISEWVIGYILGVEWEGITVAYTDHMHEDKGQYEGKYMYTTSEATPFEAMLAQVGDQLIEYETNKYGTQRLVAFSNWPTTDPFDYSKQIKVHFDKIAKVDVEHIKTTEAFKSGTFASYHVYSYYPDYLGYEEDLSEYQDEEGNINTYKAYLKKLNDYHTIPVIISEFGVPTSRGMAQKDTYTGRNQGNMSETEQGEALVKSYQDIKEAGCAGSIIFTWQDEWFKRTWNTMHAVDLLKTPYWSDYQTNEQYFGLLSFDPGKEESIAYVDGDISEWEEKDLVWNKQDMQLSMKYDEKFIYFLIYKKDFDPKEKIYVPIDLTPNSGSQYYENDDISFDRDVDFVITIDGASNSRVVVQERYEVLRAMFNGDVEGKDAYQDPPKVDSPIFKPIKLILQTPTELQVANGEEVLAETYETGLLAYGNANPQSREYNSLADFCFNEDYIEVKIPWQLLNFSNPSEMMIHDDYYLHYGVEQIQIKEMWIGLGEADEEGTIELVPVPLKGWGSKISYHERLKPAYFAMQKVWNEDGGK